MYVLPSQIFTPSYHLLCNTLAPSCSSYLFVSHTQWFFSPLPLHQQPSYGAECHIVINIHVHAVFPFLLQVYGNMSTCLPVPNPPWCRNSSRDKERRPLSGTLGWYNDWKGSKNPSATAWICCGYHFWAGMAFVSEAHWLSLNNEATKEKAWVINEFKTQFALHCNIVCVLNSQSCWYTFKIATLLN